MCRYFTIMMHAWYTTLTISRSRTASKSTTKSQVNRLLLIISIEIRPISYIPDDFEVITFSSSQMVSRTTVFLR